MTHESRRKLIAVAALTGAVGYATGALVAQHAPAEHVVRVVYRAPSPQLARPTPPLPTVLIDREAAVQEFLGGR
jgi:hypothetical protein